MAAPGAWRGGRVLRSTCKAIVMVDQNAPDLSPAHVISHYSGDQWEECVDELVEGINSPTE